MVIVRFVAQGPEATLGAIFHLGFQSESNYRLATLSTRPCDVATADYTPATVLETSGGAEPIFHVVVDSARGGYTKLTRGVTYYVNVVNRTGYLGAPSCSSGSCGAYIDFN